MHTSGSAHNATRPRPIAFHVPSEAWHRLVEAMV